jgi:hypothetical protein
MAVTDQEAGIEDETEILSPLAKQGQVRCPVSWRNLDLKTTESREG